jgi:pectin methylesterase-like acyl-CoA thioesterase
MKVALSFAAMCALALTVAVSAQEKKMPAEHTMTGCVEKGATATTATIMNTAEKGPKTIVIVDSKATLAPHVGHKVDITGVNVPAAEAEAMKPAPAKGDHYMKLSAVKMVSATCP